MKKSKKYGLVLCDHMDALQHAYKKKEILKDIPVLTQSPKLNLDKNIKTLSFSEFNNKKRFSETGLDFKELCSEIDKKIKKNQNYKLIRSVIFCSFNYLSSFYAKCKTFEENNFNKTLTIVKVNTNNKLLDENLNIPWEKIIDKKKEIEIINFYKNKYQEFNTEIKKEKDFFLSSLNFFKKKYMIRNIFYKFFLFLYNKNYIKSKKGNFIIVVDNYTLRETAINLILKGYGIKKINDPKYLKKRNNINYNLIKKILLQIEPVIDKFIKKKLCKSLQEGFKNLIIKKITFFLEQNQLSINWWLNNFKKKEFNKIVGVLSNTTTHPAGRSVFSACLIKKIPFFLFQHGVSIELCKINHHRDQLSETTYSNITFSYNKTFANLERNNKFKLGKVVPIGMPREYWIGKKSYNKKHLPFIYISTSVYSGNKFFIENDTDDVLAKFEMNLIKKVFAKQENNILYKYYTQVPFYLDEDPIITEVKKYKNINLYMKNKSLSEMVKEYRIIITSRATSTLAWALMSNKPIIFIDQANSKPLRSEAKKIISPYVFYFDSKKKNFYKSLSNFLLNGPDFIMNEFKKKKKKYRSKVYKFLQENDLGAGTRGADFIDNFLKKKQFF